MSGEAVDLDTIMSTLESEVGEDAAAEAGLTGSAEETPNPQVRDGLSELASEDGDKEPEDDSQDEAEEEGETKDDEEEAEEAEEDLDDEPDGDPEPDERDGEIAQLKAMIQEERVERKKLETYLLQQQSQAQQQGASPRQQEPQSPDPQFVSAVEALMLGGDPEQQKATLERIPPHVRNYAVDWVRGANKRMVHWEIQPERKYQEVFAPLVEEQIRRAIEPYAQARYRSEAQDALAPFREILKSPADKKAVGEILEEIPTGGHIRDRVALAIELYKSRSQGKQIAQKKRKLADKDRDLKSQKASRRRGGKRKSKKGSKALPKMDSFNAADFAEQIKGMEIDPAEWEDLIN